MPADADLVRVYHMWGAAREAVGYAQRRRREDLDTDRPLQHSLVRMLEIIGEAAASTTLPFREAHPGLLWQQMSGMRNRLIHAYFDINLDVVWRTVVEDLPPLVSATESILDGAGML